MKFVLNSRVGDKYLRKNDVVIKLSYAQFNNQMTTWIEEYNNDLMVDVSFMDFEEINWKLLAAMTNKLASQNRKLITKFSDAKWGTKLVVDKNVQLNLYYGYPITTFQELKSLHERFVYYIRPAAPLTHMLEQVSEEWEWWLVNVPNVAHVNEVLTDGTPGDWIRPEGLKNYEDYYDLIEFEDCDEVTKERALYRVYAEDRVWPGTLGSLITNLKSDALGTWLPQNFEEKRQNCRQVCQSGGACSLCYRYMNLSKELPNIMRGEK